MPSLFEIPLLLYLLLCRLVELKNWLVGGFQPLGLPKVTNVMRAPIHDHNLVRRLDQIGNLMVLNSRLVTTKSKIASAEPTNAGTLWNGHLGNQIGAFITHHPKGP